MRICHRGVTKSCSKDGGNSPWRLSKNLFESAIVSLELRPLNTALPNSFLGTRIKELVTLESYLKV